MSHEHKHSYDDPTFAIANQDTSDDAATYANPENLEARHEQLEEQLAAIGALPVKSEVVVSTKAQEMQALIDSVAFRSHIKDVARKLTMALAQKEITNQEFEQLFAAYQNRLNDFTQPTKVIHESIAGAKVPEDEPDWRQRQMKDH